MLSAIGCSRADALYPALRPGNENFPPINLVNPKDENAQSKAADDSLLPVINVHFSHIPRDWDDEARREEALLTLRKQFKHARQKFWVDRTNQYKAQTAVGETLQGLKLLAVETAAGSPRAVLGTDEISGSFGGTGTDTVKRARRAKKSEKGLGAKTPGADWSLAVVETAAAATDDFYQRSADDFLDTIVLAA